jgi:hypothetical protein
VAVVDDETGVEGVGASRGREVVKYRTAPRDCTRRALPDNRTRDITLDIPMSRGFVLAMGVE